MDAIEQNQNKEEASRRRKHIYGYLCGILSGVAYGTNPLFGLPLINDYQMPVDSVLFYRYASATICMLIWILFRRQIKGITFRQTWLLILLGIFFSTSSLLLFTSYQYIPSGIATTIIYLEPVIVALIMVMLKHYPTFQKWIAIAISFGGVVLLCLPNASAEYHWQGFLLAFLSAFSYALYMVIVNLSRRLSQISGSLLGFVTLFIGSLVFLIHSMPEGIVAIPDLKSFGLIMGLGLVPTIVSLVTMAYATRTVGATTTAVLGVMEPIAAIGFGVCLFGEPLTVNIVLGFMITAGAIVFMTLTDKISKKSES